MMKSGKALALCLLLALALACSSEKKQDFAAANAAKDYYDCLIEGRFDEFVNGMNFPNAIPAGYRSQLEDNARMFVHEQERSHQGLSAVRVVNCVNDSAHTAANALLMLCYADSTVEQVVVPMVKRDGRWYMK